MNVIEWSKGSMPSCNMRGRPAQGCEPPRPERRKFLMRRGVQRIAGALACIIWLAVGKPAVTKPASAASSVPADAAELAALKKKYQRPPAAENPAHAVSVSAIVLGSKLFAEKTLSLNGSVACGTCHDPQAGWADHNPRPKGDNGILVRRRSPTLVGMAWQSSYGWDGRHSTLEEMVLSSIRNHDEMNLTIDGAVARLAASSTYGKLFASAFPGRGISAEAIAASLAAFLRSRHLPETRFDKWVDGDESALTPAEEHGFLVFNSAAGCAACHSGWRFTDDGFHDIGLADESDPGRGAILPQIASMAHAFKTPTLRSVADRAPCTHDGSLKTLEDVIAHYVKGGVKRESKSADVRPLQLSDADRSDLRAFLQSLSPDTGHSKREQHTP
jgi:cytochrome c peroxidase